MALLSVALVGAACTDGGADTAQSSDRTEEVALSARTASGLDAPQDDELGPREDDPTGLTLVGGVETLTVTGAKPETELTLVDGDDAELLTLISDFEGQAHFAYIPDTTMTVATGGGDIPAVEGSTLTPGEYRVRTEEATSDVVRVLGVDEVAPASVYSDQEIGEGFGYITMRDGTKLSASVKLPGPIEDGPYPTVVEYSGYSPSKPDSPQPGSMIAGTLGFATVGVNMRGTGCSGGVFDVFNPAQQADGYDAIEAIAAQPWVKDNKVGMVGLSYAGIAQLYVASTQPPSLAAIAPQSVIDDPWRQQWAGGVYNDGFTKQWLEERDNQAQGGGQGWDAELIEGGDQVCERNQQIRTQNPDFRTFGRSLESFPGSASARFLQLLVPRIKVPVFLTGAYQDEQTGGRFAYLLNKFTGTPSLRVKMYNGHHPDGYSPMTITDWHDFLSFYVARKVPDIPEGLQQASTPIFEENFGIAEGFGPNRFADHLPDDYEGALAAYEAEAPIQVLVESGAETTPPGATGERVRWDFDQYPPADSQATSWFLADDGALSSEAPPDEASDLFVYDRWAGPKRTSDAGAGDFQQPEPALPINWEQAPEGKLVAYATPKLTKDVVVAGYGYLDLWVKPGADDGAVQVDLTEVRPDGSETYVQSGWLELQHAKENPELSDEFQVEYTYLAADREELEPDEWIRRKVPIPGVSHIFRAGSQLRVTVSAPGGSRPMWAFDNPRLPTDTEPAVGRGGDRPSALVMPTVTGQEIPDGLPDCDTLRGQPCRPYIEVANTPAKE
ncbi:MAG: CocE/NonD family hydrolase [Microthrixaceae bacterium]